MCCYRNSTRLDIGISRVQLLLFCCTKHIGFLSLQLIHYCKGSGWNNTNVLSSRGGGQQSHICSIGLQSRCQQACVSSGCSRRKSISLLCPAQEAACIPSSWLPPHPQSQQSSVFSLLRSFLSDHHLLAFFLGGALWLQWKLLDKTGSSLPCKILKHTSKCSLTT